MTTTVLNTLTALAALVCGLIAAWYWFRSSRVAIDPGWTLPGEPGPSEPADAGAQQMAWIAATITASNEVARLNKSASLWTAASVVFSAASAIVGALPRS